MIGMGECVRVWVYARVLVGVCVCVYVQLSYRGSLLRPWLRSKGDGCLKARES